MDLGPPVFGRISLLPEKFQDTVGQISTVLRSTYIWNARCSPDIFGLSNNFITVYSWPCIFSMDCHFQSPPGLILGLNVHHVEGQAHGLVKGHGAYWTDLEANHIANSLKPDILGVGPRRIMVVQKNIFSKNYLKQIIFPLRHT